MERIPPPPPQNSTGPEPDAAADTSMASVLTSGTKSLHSVPPEANRAPSPKSRNVRLNRFHACRIRNSRPLRVFLRRNAGSGGVVNVASHRVVDRGRPGSTSPRRASGAGSGQRPPHAQRELVPPAGGRPGGIARSLAPRLLEAGPGSRHAASLGRDIGHRSATSRCRRPPRRLRNLFFGGRSI